MRKPLAVIISPAKTMEYSESFDIQDIPALTPEATQLLKHMLTLDELELKRMWKVSDKLFHACLNTLEMLRETGLPISRTELAKPCFYGRVSAALGAYHGLQYTSMAPKVLSQQALEWIDKHLRIISGLYGCVKPFDGVLPYRLEMGAPLSMGDTQHLYGFWGAHIARALMPEPGELINLASAEYARAVLPHLPAHTHITSCIFASNIKCGKPIQRATASKIARGSMVRWMAEHNIQDAQELIHFDVGYHLHTELSDVSTDTHTQLVFVPDSTNKQA
ncbi:YaaA family protein [Collinsella sp. zg1085]|uniref:YaaA family protein n=1 Tax=Collinsella sp. zg1085 TaxID=2844380 RepID=UPI001C0B3860|nr:YaaA family protein [Collinsella sp. zg1085]QWT17226.1 YaaA family protein [Collinsella sp. zg1085]